jgi:hypothetical protein
MTKKLSVCRLISDCHGKMAEYHSLIKKPLYSIQLGDFNFTYDTLKNVDPLYHRVLKGNHDNYDMTDYPHFLGDYGVYSVGGYNFFFIRGGYSVDKEWRMPGVTWWEQEELNYQQAQDCISLYSQVLPDYVISHDAPYICHGYGIITNKWKLNLSFTTKLLQELYNIHQPSEWAFGHYHVTKNFTVGLTHFHALAELDYIDLPIKE